jgi:hypothetical protein
MGVIRSIRTAVAVLLAIALSAMLATSTEAAPAYKFDEIVDSSQGLNPDGCPAINGEGEVAFKAVNDLFVATIFRAAGRALTPIADDTGELGFLGRNPSINDLGQVSFAARLDDGSEAILVGSGGPLTTIARTEPGEFNFFVFDTSVNDAGQVAFSAEIDNFDEGLFVGSGGPVTTVYLDSTSDFAGALARPSINDAGEIAFEEDLDNGTDVISLFTGGRFVTIVDDRGRVNATSDPQLNNAGVVAFNAALDNGERGVFTQGRRGPLTTVADSSGSFSFFSFFGPSINDSGQVAFGASLDTGESGIFTGPEPVADRVIGTGERLAGSTVISLTICSEGLNAAGEIAFVAQFDDGRRGIFVATPRR